MKNRTAGRTKPVDEPVNTSLKGLSKVKRTTQMQGSLPSQSLPASLSRLPSLPILGHYVIRSAASLSYWTGQLASRKAVTTPHKHEAPRFPNYHTALEAIATQGTSLKGFSPVPVGHAYQSKDDAQAYDAVLATWQSGVAASAPGYVIERLCMTLARLDRGDPNPDELEPFLGNNWMVGRDTPAARDALGHDTRFVSQRGYDEAVGAAYAARAQRYLEVLPSTRFNVAFRT